jgi:hypothetical protein
MTTSPSVKQARAAITKIRALTNKFVSRAEYWTCSAGQSLHYYNQEQGDAGQTRRKARLRSQIKKLVSLSYSLDDCTRATIQSLCDCTEMVLAHCDHFPRACEWPGLQHVNRQKRLIADLRSRLKRGPK